MTLPVCTTLSIIFFKLSSRGMIDYAIFPCQKISGSLKTQLNRYMMPTKPVPRRRAVSNGPEGQGKPSRVADVVREEPTF